jgi:hypothetical protein
VRISCMSTAKSNSAVKGITMTTNLRDGC